MPPTKMQSIGRRLIAAEHDPLDPNAARAAFRVCRKLGHSLSVLTGPKGFSSLLARALSRASEEAPWLNQLVVDGSGALVHPAPEAEAKVSSRDLAQGGLALVVHLLELLATFIGEALTLRLVQQVWPRAKLDSKKASKVLS